MQLTLTHNLPALQQHITRLHDRLDGDLTPLMTAIGGVLRSSTRERFESERDPQGFGWAQLSFRTEWGKTSKGERAKWRAGKKRLGQLNVRGGILKDRGELLKSITERVTTQSVAVGTDRHYGRYHQEGTARMPARPFLGLSTEDEHNILQAVQNFIDGAFA